VRFWCTLAKSVCENRKSVFDSLTFGEKTTGSIRQMSSKIPSVTKIVVSLYQFDSVSFP